MITGEVWDWGRNDFGVLGNGTTTDAVTPGRMRAAGGAAAVSVGGFHSLVLRTTGRVRACGWNNFGQLGDGATTDRLALVDVPGLDQVIKISAGSDHSLALREDGTVWAWGENFHGQLGDGTQVTRVVPTQVIGVPPCVAVSASFGHHSMGLADDGTVWVWGYNAEGQHGNGSSNPVNGVGATPDRVTGLEGVVAIAAGSWHCLALTGDGVLWSWGDNLWGQLGDGTTINRFTPTTVTGLGDVVAIGRGGGHTVALRSDGTVWAWGLNDVGQLGDGTTTGRAIPGTVPGLQDVVLLTGAGGGGVAVSADGVVRSWGNNNRGQLGDGTKTQRLNPVSVVAPQHVVDVAGGAFSTAVLIGHESGFAVACGANDFGQLGDGTLDDHLTSVPVATGELTVLSAGAFHTSAIRPDGTVLGWGNNNAGQLGTGTRGSTSPPVVALLTEAVAIAAGHHHTVAAKADGTAWAWGGNGSGELGNGQTVDGEAPVQVTGLSDVVAVGAGADHSLALLADGTVWSWGNDGFGQLGDGPAMNSRSVPGIVPGLTEVCAIAVGAYHNLALLTDGAVWAWGLNDVGQLGDGTTTDASAPKWVPLPAPIARIAAGGWHSQAAATDGTCWRWGYDGVGPTQTGSPIGGPIPTPTRMGGLARVRDVAGGLYHGLALQQLGSIAAWGTNNRGALGDSTTTSRAAPVTMSNSTDVVAITAGGGFSVALIGTRTLRLIPARLDFGHQQVGTAGTPRTAWLTNTGRRPVTVTDIRVVDDRDGFLLLGSACPSVLGRGRSCAVQLAFQPTVPRPRSGVLLVVSNAVGSPHHVELAGLGIK
jgi:alpha-tubulin suppressor-like RCC1 family protein